MLILPSTYQSYFKYVMKLQPVHLQYLDLLASAFLKHWAYTAAHLELSLRKASRVNGGQFLDLSTPGYHSASDGISKPGHKS